MLNSIVLSSDMEKLYLIDNGRAIEFPLSERGVVIGLIGDQVSVATAMKIPGPPIDETTLGKEDTAEEPATRAATKKAILPAPEPPLFPVNLKISLERSQWALSFNPQSGYLFAIGATDIDFDRPDVIVKPRIHIFDIRKGVIRVTKVGKVLNFSFLQKS